MSLNFKGLYLSKLHTYDTLHILPWFNNYLAFSSAERIMNGLDVLSHCNKIPSSQLTEHMKAQLLIFS